MHKNDLENDGHNEDGEKRDYSIQFGMFESILMFFLILATWQYGCAQVNIHTVIDVGQGNGYRSDQQLFAYK